MDYEFVYTDETDERFVLLDEEQSIYYLELLGKISLDFAELYGPKNDFFVIVVLLDGEPIACGAFMEYNSDSVELKRVYVKDRYRNKGIGREIVEDLERIAKDKGYGSAILETNLNMPEAIAFYDKLNYQLIDNYPPFVENKTCICMMKRLK